MTVQYSSVSTVRFLSAQRSIVAVLDRQAWKGQGHCVTLTVDLQ